MRILLALVILCFTAPAFAKNDQKIDRFTADAYEVLDLAKLQWADEPNLPKGAKIALFAGNPETAGVFMAYLKFPANYTIPAHTHPYAELITVLKGRVGNGIGEKFDRNKGDVLEAGSSFTLPANTPHYLWNDEEVVVLLIATGPWNITYSDQKDDPRIN